MAVGEEEELGDFEQCAECACAHGSSKRSFQFAVGSVQTEGTEDKSSFARSGYGVTGIKHQEEHGGESGKDRKIPEVGIPIGPLPDPTGYPSHLAHVRRRREGADKDRREQRERERVIQYEEF